jgi:hypothetical protein
VYTAVFPTKENYEKDTCRRGRRCSAFCSSSIYRDITKAPKVFFSNG